MDLNKNILSESSSPYLLQHANNPVHWQTWSPEILELAKSQNKIILVSIGYSACHWCHVMEHECFEDQQVADFMNEHFINVKVDREERPDVDNVYMTAVQIMQKQGGWPLNCFTLPDGRPIHGGTYFPKPEWLHLLRGLVDVFKNNPQKVEEYASNLAEGLRQSSLIPKKEVPSKFSAFDSQELVQRWTKKFDLREGGANHAPKFPLPNNYSFLFKYAYLNKHEGTMSHCLQTLDKMCRGGIYDQIGGGFSRYSVDMLWKVPHFEKMLYDNGQLLSLYADAYAVTKKEEYQRVLEQTVNWMAEEMLAPDGGIYAALDADSEGEEGKYYCWSEKELLEELSEDQAWALKYFEVNERGFWESNKYILLRRRSDQQWANDFGWSLEEFHKRLDEVMHQLKDKRSKRVRPGTDNKRITSWNAIALSGLLRTNEVLGDVQSELLQKATADFLLGKMMTKDGRLNRIYNDGKVEVEGFLEDYAFTIQALIDLHQNTLEQEYLTKAEVLMEYCLQEFSDEKSGLFYFVSKESELINRNIEIHDNVMPSPNGVMAKNLFFLSVLNDKPEYKKRAEQMLANVLDNMTQFGASFSNWADLHMWMSRNFYTIKVSNQLSKKEWRGLKEMYLPNILFNSELSTDKSFQVCDQSTCFVKTTEIKEVVDFIAALELA